MCVRVLPADFVEPPIYFMTLNPRYVQEDIFRPHGIKRSDEIIFVLDGEGELVCEGKRYSLRKGSAFYLRAGVGHDYYSDGSLVTAWITFQGTVLKELDCFLKGRKFLFCEEAAVQRYSALLEQMRREYFDKRREGLLSSMVYTLIMEFLEEERRGELSGLEQVLIYLEENYHKKITLDKLAEINKTSKSTFCKEFRRAYGCTAFEKLMEVRLYMAAHMLRTNAVDKISVIAGRCGFEDAAYFGRAFRKRFGCSPGGFRNKQ